MKSCEFCNCNNYGYCVYIEEKLTKESSLHCNGYRDKKSISLTTRQYMLIADALERRCSKLSSMISNTELSMEQEEALKELSKELEEIVDSIAPLSV